MQFKQYQSHQLTVLANENVSFIRLLSYPSNRSHTPKGVSASNLRFEIATRMRLSNGDRELAKELSNEIFSEEKPCNQSSRTYIF